jgi:hypothetical protein
MPDQSSESQHSYDGGYFNSEGCDILEIREEDTQPGPRLSEQERQRLAKKYGRKLPPKPPAQQP